MAGELDLELALSKDEEGDEDVPVAPAMLFSLPPPATVVPAAAGELGDDDLLLLLVLSAAFSTDK